MLPAILVAALISASPFAHAQSGPCAATKAPATVLTPQQKAEGSTV
jgi:hypothetical protein